MSEPEVMLLSFVVTCWLAYFAARVRLRIGGMSMHGESGVAFLRDTSTAFGCASTAMAVWVLVFRVACYVMEAAK